MVKAATGLALGAAIFLTCFLAPLPAEAGGCAAAPVTARGEEARYVWLAKLKTRALWRQKVRSIPGLGPDYANWSRAENTEERCLSGGAGTVCIFTGVPCLP